MLLPHRGASSHDGSMHTTIDLSPAAHERIKASAAARGVSMSRFLSDGVQAHIDQIAGHPDACRNSLKKNIRPNRPILKSIRAVQRKKRRRHPEN